MRVKLFLRITFVCLLHFSMHAQKSYSIKRSENPIDMDGLLNEVQWKKANIATDFTISSPIYGGKSRFISLVKMYYSDDAIYIGAELYDPSPDSVNYTLSQRDDTGNAVWNNH